MSAPPAGYDRFLGAECSLAQFRLGLDLLGAGCDKFRNPRSLGPVQFRPMQTATINHVGLGTGNKS